MANFIDRHPENVPGRFYVDDSCLPCVVCLDICPSVFHITDDRDHAFVAKQPETKEEIETCAEAVEACPMNAIGNDGEDYDGGKELSEST
jgi:ferredoxin